MHFVLFFLHLIIYTYFQYVFLCFINLCKLLYPLKWNNSDKFTNYRKSKWEYSYETVNLRLRYFRIFFFQLSGKFTFCNFFLIPVYIVQGKGGHCIISLRQIDPFNFWWPFIKVLIVLKIFLNSNSPVRNLASALFQCQL